MAHKEKLSRRQFLDISIKLGTVQLAAGCLPCFGGMPLEDDEAVERWRIGCYTRPWDKHDYRVALDAIAEAGFKHVGLMTTKSKTRLVISAATTLDEAHAVGAEAKKRGLSVPSVYGGGIPVQKSLAAGIEDLKKLIDNCTACGGRNLMMGGIGNDELYNRYYKAIAECCDYAAEKNVGISVKPHGGLNATGPQCRKTIETVAHKNFRIWYDPGNIYYYSNAELDPVDDAPSVDGLVVGMCVKDYIHPKKVLVTPPDGMVDFPAVFERLKKGGFTAGPLIIECLQPGDLPHLLTQAKKARRFVEELTGQTAPANTAATSEAQLKAGIAVVDITPPLGYRMSGYFHERLSTGASNPLKAKALVLSQGPQKTAMVFCDIIGLFLDVTDRARKIASEKTGIPAQNIVITATHTHTGPLYAGALRNHFHEKALTDSGADPHERIDYPAALIDKIVEAICNADASLRPATLRSGTTAQQGLSYNRRFHMKDGPVRFNPGVLNPDIVRVAGPIDPDLGIVFIHDAQTTAPLGAILNFALHLATTGGTQYAADYPFYIEQTLRQKHGSDFVLFFGTGTCGDINHIDVTRRDRLKTDHIGTTLAKTVLAAADQLTPVAQPGLAVLSDTVNAPLQQFSDAEIAWARENINKVGTGELSFLDQVRAYKILARQLRKGNTIPLEVQAVRLSKDVAIVALPGEVFVDLGLAIKQKSPFPLTLVIELSQDAPGYIPTEKAFAEGSYETVNSRIAPGGGEKMADLAITLLKKLAKT